MSTGPQLPVYAQWKGQEFRVDWPSHRSEPEVGDVIYIGVDSDGGLKRRPFLVTNKRGRRGRDRGFERVAIDLDVEPATY